MSRTIVCIDVRVVIQRLLTDRGRTLARCTVRYERAMRQGVLNFLARGWQHEAAMIDTAVTALFAVVPRRLLVPAPFTVMTLHNKVLVGLA